MNRLRAQRSHQYCGVLAVLARAFGGCEPEWVCSAGGIVTDCGAFGGVEVFEMPAARVVAAGRGERGCIVVIAFRGIVVRVRLVVYWGGLRHGLGMLAGGRYICGWFGIVPCGRWPIG